MVSVGGGTGCMWREWGGCWSSNHVCNIKFQVCSVKKNVLVSAALPIASQNMEARFEACQVDETRKKGGVGGGRFPLLS